MLRIVFENLIILKFLLENDNSCCDDWYNWGKIKVFNTYPKIIGEDERIIETMFKDFANWKIKTINSISKLYGNNKVNSILNNTYGWAYSKNIKHLTLASIAKNCNADLAYDYFKFLSSTVHSNTSELQSNISRFEHHTFNIAKNIINAITLISTYLFDYIINDDNYHDFINALNKATTYQEKYSKFFFKFLKEEGKKEINEYLNNENDDN